jgi:GTPase SAR1 family protein
MSEIYDVTFIHPSRWLVYGPSCSGKTTFVSNLMDKSTDYFNVHFDRKILCTDTNSKDKFKDFEIINDIENIDLSQLDKNKNTILILDDKMDDAIDNEMISKIYTQFSHHNNITIILLTQNLFPKSKYMRNIFLNSSYIVLMKNPCELLQIMSLSKRLNRGGAKTKLIDAYIDCTQEPYSHLIVDLNQDTPNVLRLRSKIFSKDFSQIVYI